MTYKDSVIKCMQKLKVIDKMQKAFINIGEEEQVDLF